MSEFNDFREVSEPNQYELVPVFAAHHITAAGQLALGRMIEHYGGGYPEYVPGSEVSFAAHNGLDGVEVGANAERMAEELNLRHPYVALGKATGEAHDAILTDGNGKKLARDEMEERTAEYFGELLRNRGVEEEFVLAGELGVLGTKTTFTKEGLLVGQAVSEMEFPSKTAEAMAMSVASADMAGAYSPRGPINALEYYKELRGIQAHERVVFDPGDLAQYYQFQRGFLGAYKFPHPLGEELFGKDRTQLNDFYQQIAEALQAGDIEDWGQLHALSEAYARQ